MNLSWHLILLFDFVELDPESVVQIHQALVSAANLGNSYRLSKMSIIIAIIVIFIVVIIIVNTIKPSSSPHPDHAPSHVDRVLRSLW